MTRSEARLWKEMLARSFRPAQWYEDGPHGGDGGSYEGKIMWVYRRTEGGWTVGFYTPEGQWCADSDHSSSEDAANRVHWLNGGL